jgi:hypothetical protein
MEARLTGPPCLMVAVYKSFSCCHKPQHCHRIHRIPCRWSSVRRFGGVEAALEDCGFLGFSPETGAYVFTGQINDSLRTFKSLFESIGIFCIPSDGFGHAGKGCRCFVRISRKGNKLVVLMQCAAQRLSDKAGSAGYYDLHGLRPVLSFREI